MRLTNDLRSTIIGSILKEIPRVDNSAAIEKLTKDEAYAQLPNALKVAVETDTEVRNYLATDSLYYGPFNGCVVLNRHYEPTDSTLKQVQKLQDETDESESKIRKLRCELWGVLSSITTVEKLIKQIPEFEKHIPDTSKPLENLPVTNVIAHLLTAGWNGKSKTPTDEVDPLGR